MKDENESDNNTSHINIIEYCPNEDLTIESVYHNLNFNESTYKIKLCKTKRNIVLLINNNYELRLNLNELISTNILFNICKNIDDIYKYFTSLFTRKKIVIKKIIEKQMIILQLILKNYLDDEENTMELILLYKNQNKDFIINDIYNKYNILNNEMNKIKNDYNRINNKLNKTIYEINKLKEELKQNNNNDNNSNISNRPSKNNFNEHKIFDMDPSSLNSVYNLVNDSYNIDYLDNTFTLYTSKNNSLCLVYATENKSIKCYSFGNQKVIKEIKNAHDDYITNFRHCFNKINNEDIIISISGWINDIKLWDGNTWQCMLHISNVYSNGYLFSSAFLIIKHTNYFILASNRNHLSTAEPIKLYDLTGKLITTIPDSNDNTCFIDTFYEKEKIKNIEIYKYYIITGNSGHVKVFNYSNNKLYKKYHEKDNKADHFCVIIKKMEDNIKLIESCGDGFIRIWGFHDGNLNSKIDCKNGLLSICMWNNDFLFTGCKDNTIKLIDIKNKKIVKSLSGHNNYVCTIRKIVHPKYGGCIISQSWHNDDIKIWMNNNMQ